MLNTFCIPVRNRPKNLKAFINFWANNFETKDDECILSSGDYIKSQHNFIFADTSDEPADNKLFKPLPFSEYYWWKDIKTWNKSKLMNFASMQCDSNFITFLDVDCVPEVGFIHNLTDKLIKNKDNINYKVSHNYRFLDNNVSMRLTQEAEKQTPKYDELFKSALKNVKEKFFRIQSPLYDGKKVGTAQFTMQLKTFFDLGGMDQRFTNYACEDYEMAFRYYTLFGEPVINDKETYHLFHEPTPDSKDENEVAKKWKLFEELKRNNFPILHQSNFGIID
jgi:hypothetical protein